MFLFVILFGLSMDYHVFILSRIREAYDRGLSTDDAIAYGIKTTAGVVTSAAIVMVGVFSVFAMLPLLDLKEMGIGLAAAVLIDATIVRAVLLPASMKLLGESNWYLPKWLEWLPSLEHEARPSRSTRPRPLSSRPPNQLRYTARCAACRPLARRRRTATTRVKGINVYHRSPHAPRRPLQHERGRGLGARSRGTARHRRCRAPRRRRQLPPAEPRTSAGDHLLGGLVPLAPALAEAPSTTASGPVSARLALLAGFFGIARRHPRPSLPAGAEAPRAMTTRDCSRSSPGSRCSAQQRDALDGRGAATTAAGALSSAGACSLLGAQSSRRVFVVPDRVLLRLHAHSPRTVPRRARHPATRT